ncbi:MAG: DHH family phosphoesterase [Bacilli bacterium]
MKILDKKRELKKTIKTSSNVFITGHLDLDLDALGSIIGVNYIVNRLKKKSLIILDDKKHEKGVNKVLLQIKDKYNFITSNKINDIIDEKSLLIIVDTNKEKLISKNILGKFKNIIIIDHHDLTKESINNALLIVDDSTSSTCEMITELIINYNILLNSDIATLLLSGIVLDTSNFVIKTNALTYYCAAFLTNMGASPKKVQYLLKQDIKKYIERQKVITEVKIINKKIALTAGSNKEIYRREDLAKIADTLLLFEEIEGSFVIGKLDKKAIGISARSMGKVDVGKILKKFNGGGDTNNAAARIEESTISKVKQDLIKIIKNI